MSTPILMGARRDFHRDLKSRLWSRRAGVPSNSDKDNGTSVRISRLASIAIGTGDIDCTYHVALLELREVVQSGDWGDAEEMLAIMIDGKRLRDISDLPLDLAI